MGRVGRRLVVTAAGAVAAVLLAIPASAMPTPDPADDFLADCAPDSAGQPGEPAMDLRSAEAVIGLDGMLRLHVETGGDALAYMASNPPSAAIAFYLEDASQTNRVSVVHEVHEGAVRTEAHLGSDPLDTAIEVAPGGPNRVSITTGIDARAMDLAWFRVTTFVTPPGGTFVCDLLGAQDAPLALTEEVPATTTTRAAASTTEAPSATGAPPTTGVGAVASGAATSPPGAEGGGGGEGDDGFFGMSWWLLLLAAAFALFGVGGLWWWFQRVRGGGARAADSIDRLFGEHPPQGGASHGAPRDPPPGANDFGE